MPRRPADLQMRSQLVGPVLAMARARGADPAELLRRFGLPPGAAEAHEVVLPLPTLRALLTFWKLGRHYRTYPPTWRTRCARRWRIPRSSSADRAR